MTVTSIRLPFLDIYFFFSESGHSAETHVFRTGGARPWPSSEDFFACHSGLLSFPVDFLLSNPGSDKSSHEKIFASAHFIRGEINTLFKKRKNLDILADRTTRFHAERWIAGFSKVHEMQRSFLGQHTRSVWLWIQGLWRFFGFLKNILWYQTWPPGGDINDFGLATKVLFEIQTEDFSFEERCCRWGQLGVTCS